MAVRTLIIVDSKGREHGHYFPAGDRCNQGHVAPPAWHEGWRDIVFPVAVAVAAIVVPAVVLYYTLH